MSETTFYWHDYETFGLHRRTDRPVQFAGIRTDANFEVIGEPDVWYCKTAPDYLPQPEACLLTGLTPQVAHERGAVTEAEFASRIEGAFRTPGTVSIGYNTLRFDDEVTRFLFWRNLKDPYAREWANGCSRWDLFPLVRAVWALRPEGIIWPEAVDENGKKRITFKLEKLSAANGLEHSHAHDATSDVYATIGLAKLIAKQNPRFWQWAFENRTKAAVRAAFKGEDGPRPVVYIDSSAGQDRGYIRILYALLPIEGRPDIIAWDCREDPTVLSTLSGEEIKDRVTRAKELKEEGIEPLGLCRIRPNQFPFVCPNLAVLKKSAVSRFAIDLEAVAHNVDILREILPEVQDKIEALVADKREEEKVDADAALYNGFPSDADKALMFHVAKLTPEEIAQEVAAGKLNFSDERLNEILWRKRARNWPETLTEEEKIRWRAFCAARLQGLLPNTLSLQAYLEEIDETAERDCEAMEGGTLTAEKFEERQKILDDLYNWGEFVGAASQEEDTFGE